MKALFLTPLLVLTLTSCSVYMAANQEDKKDLSLLKEGVLQSTLIGAYGMPESTVKDPNYGQCDIFRFKQGYNSGVKAGRTALHATADVLTLGIWEVVGTPIESAADGTMVAYQVCYDEDHRANLIVPLSSDSANERNAMK